MIPRPSNVPTTAALIARWRASIPFGGVKGLGLGVELGSLGLEKYTGVQVLTVKRS